MKHNFFFANQPFCNKIERFKKNKLPYLIKFGIFMNSEGFCRIWAILQESFFQILKFFFLLLALKWVKYDPCKVLDL